MEAGTKSVWVPLDKTFAIWKSEVKPQVAVPDKPYLEDYPGEYFYDASEWKEAGRPPIVVLSKCH
jgi:hypothetical protein